MKNFISRIIGILKERTGHTMVEYSILLAAIAVVCIVVVELVGGSAGHMFGSAGNNGAWTP
jgi:Flp pilus assembly pilin Flp